MAVKININLGAFFAKISPVAKQLHADLLQAGVEFHVTPLAIKLAKEGEVLHSIPLASSAVKNVLAGTQSANVPWVETHLKQAMVALTSQPAPDAAKAPVFPKPNMTFTKPQLVPAKDAPAGYPVFPKDKLKSAPPVYLAQADKLYQPCHGTSAGSRYYLIGAAGPLKVAARIMPGRVSIRLEAPVIGQQLREHLTEIGMKVADTAQGKPYASLHVETDTEILQRKVVGSVLMAIDQPLDTPFPDVTVIRGL